MKQPVCNHASVIYKKLLGFWTAKKHLSASHSFRSLYTCPPLIPMPLQSVCNLVEGVSFIFTAVKKSQWLKCGGQHWWWAKIDSVSVRLSCFQCTLSWHMMAQPQSQSFLPKVHLWHSVHNRNRDSQSATSDECSTGGWSCCSLVMTYSHFESKEKIFSVIVGDWILIYGDAFKSLFISVNTQPCHLR